MTKQVNFNDIAPRFTKSAAYCIDVPWIILESTLREWEKWTPIDIDPDYQRAHVWTKGQQIRYVEYIMRGGHAAKEIYWNCAGWPNGLKLHGTPMELVDGKQRLTAVRRFLANDLPVFGFFKDQITKFPGLDLALKFYVNNLETRKEVLQWYLDLNEGGTPHTEDELAKVRALLKKES